jgi:hypothetical protein
MLQTMPPRKKKTKDDQKESLKIALLNYFLQPQFSAGIQDLPEFKNYRQTDIRQMIHALTRTRLIQNVGKRGVATVYQTTKAGRAIIPPEE